MTISEMPQADIESAAETGSKAAMAEITGFQEGGK
jgi:hypothetical protein